MSTSNGASDHVIRTGNLFQSGCSTLVNAVNCRGVMGAGIAAEFAVAIRRCIGITVCRCQAGTIELGRPYAWTSGEGPPPVLNFPTKDHWRERSQLGPIVEGLAWLRSHYEEWGVESLAVPALGCGLGGIRWQDARPP